MKTRAPLSKPQYEISVRAEIWKVLLSVCEYPVPQPPNDLVFVQDRNIWTHYDCEERAAKERTPSVSTLCIIHIYIYIYIYIYVDGIAGKLY
jgi:hypothetical protein